MVRCICRAGKGGSPIASPKATSHIGQNRPDYFVDIFLTKAFLSKLFEGEMFIRILPTTLLQIFRENLLYFQVIFKSMKIADNTFPGNSECEWVKKSCECV